MIDLSHCFEVAFNRPWALVTLVIVNRVATHSGPDLFDLVFEALRLFGVFVAGRLHTLKLPAVGTKRPVLTTKNVRVNWYRWLKGQFLLQALHIDPLGATSYLN